MRALQRSVVLIVMALAVNACWGHRGEPTPADPYTRSTLHIDNHNWLDVDIFVEHDGQRSRLGTVVATSSQDFVFPPTMLGQQGTIRLIADPVGSSSGIVTEFIVVKPGTQVTWTLETSLRRSSLSVY
jgi:hypothetical protein